jgi:ATP-dependent RNA helicase DeaD
MHGVKPGNIVGAIANEAGVDSRNIGRVDIRDDHSLVDLPAGMPDNILQHLKQVWVVGQQLRIVEEGKPFDPPRKPGKLALAGDKPRFKKPKFEKSKPRPKPTKTPNRKTPNRGLP